MELRTIREFVKQAKIDDPKTAINESLIRTLVSNNLIPHLKNGNRTYIDYSVGINAIVDLTANISQVETSPKSNSNEHISRFSEDPFLRAKAKIQKVS